jgi:hypothetical protein
MITHGGAMGKALPTMGWPVTGTASLRAMVSGARNRVRLKYTPEIGKERNSEHGFRLYIDQVSGVAWIRGISHMKSFFPDLFGLVNVPGKGLLEFSICTLSAAQGKADE